MCAAGYYIQLRLISVFSIAVCAAGYYIQLKLMSVLSIAVCAAGYHRVPELDICALCGDAQPNTFKSTPGNATMCTLCGNNTVSTADHTACGTFIFRNKSAAYFTNNTTGLSEYSYQKNMNEYISTWVDVLVLPGLVIPWRLWLGHILLHHRVTWLYILE